MSWRKFTERPPELRKWLGMASNDCSHCYGTGTIYKARGFQYTVCLCVYRHMFRSCRARRNRIIDQGRYPVKMTNRVHGPFAEIPSIDFCVDFETLPKLVLEPAEYKIFKLVFIAGADWRIGTSVTGLNRGMYFHKIYDIEVFLGRAFEAHGLFPMEEYFGCRASEDTEVSNAYINRIHTNHRTKFKDSWLGGGNFSDYVGSDQYNPSKGKSGRNRLWNLTGEAAID